MPIVVQLDVMLARRKVKSKALAEYVGRYETPACALNIALPDIELTLSDSALLISFTARGGYPTKESPQPAPPPAPLAFIGPDRVTVLDIDAEDLFGEFLRDVFRRTDAQRFQNRKTTQCKKSHRQFYFSHVRISANESKTKLGQS